MSDENQAGPQPSEASSKPRLIKIRPVTVILFLTLNLLALMIFGWPYLQARYELPWDVPFSLLPTSTYPVNTETLTSTPIPIQTMAASATLPSVEVDPALWSQGLVVLSLQEDLDAHLFAYQPVADLGGSVLPLTRLTSGSWQDITPALSPDEDHLIFASNRGGFWNLYLLDLLSGEVSQVTNSPDFQASPSWSPDGLWVAYETHIGDNLEIFIQPVDQNTDPIQLTAHPGADYEPAWSPNGRQIAFVSTRSGRSQIWLANLDESGIDRFQQISAQGDASASHPVWSPDGRSLAWGAVTKEGLHKIYLWESQSPGSPPREIGSGDWPAWSPDGKALLAVLNTPYESYLVAYPAESQGYLILPPLELPGEVSGLLWADLNLSGDLVAVEAATTTPLWKPNIQLNVDGIEGRWDLVTLEDVKAPYPRLHDRVDESFQSLRLELATMVGWDLLADLENAFIPLSSAMAPGQVANWLYTGRAFRFNPLPINAGWIAVVREDFGQETYWRVYLRSRFQDGSQGLPLRALPWDFNARYSGQPLPYEQGGELASAVPSGYWVDMTRVAAAYGWQRLPALSNWRAAYPSARFNEFVQTDGLDWTDAMLEIYPSEVLITLTPIPTPTTSLTPVPLWYQSPTPTPTSSFTITPTQTFTNTLSGSMTPTETARTPSPTPSPTGTMTNTP